MRAIVGSSGLAALVRTVTEKPTLLAQFGDISLSRSVSYSNFKVLGIQAASTAPFMVFSVTCLIVPLTLF